MKDIRTPDTYYATPETVDAKIKQIHSKLDDLVDSIEIHRNKTRITPAEKRILETEKEKADKLLYKRISDYHATKVVEAFAFGGPRDASIAIAKALNFKCRYRVEPALMAAGSEIEQQVFR